MYNATATQEDLNDLVLDLTSENEATIFLTDPPYGYTMVCYGHQDKQAVIYNDQCEEFLASDLSDEVLDAILDELVMGRYYKK